MALKSRKQIPAEVIGIDLDEEREACIALLTQWGCTRVVFTEEKPAALRRRIDTLTHFGGAEPPKFVAAPDLGSQRNRYAFANAITAGPEPLEARVQAALVRAVEISILASFNNLFLHPFQWMQQQGWARDTGELFLWRHGAVTARFDFLDKMWHLGHSGTTLAQTRNFPTLYSIRFDGTDEQVWDALRALFPASDIAYLEAAGYRYQRINYHHVFRKASDGDPLTLTPNVYTDLEWLASFAHPDRSLHHASAKGSTPKQANKNLQKAITEAIERRQKSLDLCKEAVQNLAGISN